MDFYANFVKNQNRKPYVRSHQVIMKKQKFIPESRQLDEFVIYHLSASLPDYRLAYHLNKKLGTGLEREADLQVYHSSSKSAGVYSFYFCENDHDRNIFLIHSISGENPLMKSYFLILQGFFQQSAIEKIILEIENISEVLSINKIDLSGDGIRKKSPKKIYSLVVAILTDLEVHMIEIKKKRSEQNVKLIKKSGKRRVLYK